MGYNSVSDNTLAAIGSQICEIPRNSEKLELVKVIELGVNRKRRCNFLLVVNSNY